MKTKKDVERVPADKYRVVTQAQVAKKLQVEMIEALNELDGQSHGIACVEFKVLVRPVKAEERTKGGIVLPEQVVEKDQHAAMEGQLAGLSPLAFTYEEWPVTEAKPRIGDTVIFARYSGITVKGADGVEYRIMNDKDVVAVRRARHAG